MMQERGTNKKGSVEDTYTHKRLLLNSACVLASLPLNPDCYHFHLESSSPFPDLLFSSLLLPVTSFYFATVWSIKLTLSLVLSLISSLQFSWPHHTLSHSQLKSFLSSGFEPPLCRVQWRCVLFAVIHTNEDLLRGKTKISFPVSKVAVNVITGGIEKMRNMKIPVLREKEKWTSTDNKSHEFGRRWFCLFHFAAFLLARYFHALKICSDSQVTSEVKAQDKRT